jgi:hypothetical protein
LLGGEGVKTKDIGPVAEDQGNKIWKQTKRAKRLNKIGFQFFAYIEFYTIL